MKKRRSPIYQALRVSATLYRATPSMRILEVQQHLGEGRVRTVAMEATTAWCAA